MSEPQHSVVHGQPCTVGCNSSDAMSYYFDDNPRRHCYSCGKTVLGLGDEASTKKLTRITVRKKMTNEMIAGGEYIDLRSSSDEFINRNIDRDVAEKYGVKIAGPNSNPASIIFPFYNESGDYVAQKVRKRGVPGKGIWHGDSGTAKALFGAQLW